jgi:hypothetical protein
MSGMDIKPSLPRMPLSTVSRTASAPDVSAPEPKSVPEPKAMPVVSEPPAPKTEESEVLSVMESVTPAAVMTKAAALKSTGVDMATLLGKKKAPQASDALPSLAASQASIEQNFKDLKAYFQAGFHKLRFDKEGHLSSDTSVGTLMSARYNPLASSKDKLESELFRAFAKQEFSSENPHCFDEIVELITTKPGTADFDAKLDRIVNQHILTGASQEVNIGSQTRINMTAAYDALQLARKQLAAHPDDEPAKIRFNQAQAKALEEIQQVATDVINCMKMTASNYRKSSFPIDYKALTQVSPFQFAQRKYAGSLTDPTRRKEFRDCGKIYAKYRQEERQRKLDSWHGTEAGKQYEAEVVAKEKAFGHKRGTAKFGLYNFFFAPFKTYR